MNYVAVLLIRHLCQDGGPGGRGDTLIQLVPSFRGIGVVTMLRDQRPRNQSSITGMAKMSPSPGLRSPLSLQFNRYVELFLHGRGAQDVKQVTLNSI